MTSWLDSAGRTRRKLLMHLAVLVFVAPLATCDQTVEAPAAAASAPPPAVTVISVQPTEVRPSIAFNGRVVAVDTVELRARVTGFLEQRLFGEGADVKARDLLFVIEARTTRSVGSAGRSSKSMRTCIAS